MSQSIDNLTKAQNDLLKAEACLRQGQVIYAYRHMGYVIQMLSIEYKKETHVKDSDDKLRACGRIQGRLRKGEQLDAHNEIKSLLDKIRNAIRKLEQAQASRPSTNPTNP